MTTLKGYLASAEEGKLHVSEKVKAFWKSKLESHEELLQVLAPTGSEELKKQYLEKAIQVWKVGLKEVLEKVNKELVGPYALGSSRIQSPPGFFFLSPPFNKRTATSIFHRFSIRTGPPEIDTTPFLNKPPIASASFDDSLTHFHPRCR